MNSRIACILLLLSLIRVIDAHASNEERETHQATDHFLTYTMGIVGGGISALMVYHRFEEALRDADDFRPAHYEDNKKLVRKVVIAFILCGTAIGAGAGYLLECIFRQQE